jgi:hypothetical protein
MNNCTNPRRWLTPWACSCALCERAWSAYVIGRVFDVQPGAVEFIQAPVDSGPPDETRQSP